MEFEKIRRATYVDTNTTIARETNAQILGGQICQPINTLLEVSTAVGTRRFSVLLATSRLTKDALAIIAAASSAPTGITSCTGKLVTNVYLAI